MRNKFKKIGALVLVVALMLSLNVVAFATTDPDLGSYEGSNNRGYGVTDGKIKLTKSLIIFNPDGSQVREPNLKFVYTVTPETTNLGTITDDGRYNKIGDPATETPVTVKVNAGVASGVGGTTIEYKEDNAKVAAIKTGTEVEKTGNLTVDLSKFSHAGVYRYLITETVTSSEGTAISDLTTYGLEARTSEYEATRYLDVYIINGTSGLELSSAVIFKTISKDDSNPANNAKDAITTTTDKTTGFEPGTPASGEGANDYTNDTDVDRYFTYNLKVGKTTTGTLADKSNDFPFEIKLTAASTLVPTVVADVSKSGATYQGTEPTTVNIKAGNGNDATLTPKMSDGDYIEVIGLPKGTTVTVKETNNTPDVYTASWDTVAGTTSTGVTAESDNTTKTDLNLANGKSAFTSAAVKIDGNQTSEYVKTVLGFTNNLAEISPTGVVLRVAPYAMMLAAGIFLLLFSRKYRRNEAEA